MPIPKKNQLIGLDIGSHSIKLVEIHDLNRGRVLKNFGLIGLPPGAIVEGNIKEMEVVASAIRELYKNLNVKNRNVAIAISGFSVIVKKITVSTRKESELESTIHDEAEQYIPFDINEVNLDFDVLSVGEGSLAAAVRQGEKDVGGQMEVMLVAAKKDIVDDYVSLLNSADLNPVVLDVDVFALQNAFEISVDEKEGCYALVNIGAEELGINIIRNGVSLFTRDSSYGGSQITTEIMSRMKVNFEDAERIKLGATEVDREKAGLEEIFSTAVSEWVQETKRALDFVGSSYPDETIGRIYVSGGSYKIPGFKKLLEMKTEIPVEELNAFKNISADEKRFDPNYLKEIGPQAAVAVGLGLRSIGDK